MKTKLLLLFVLIAQITIAQNLVISEIMVNPSGTDSPYEYIEFRGDAGATIAADTYLIMIEGDGESNPGDIESNGNATNGCTVNNDGVTPCPQGGIIDLSGITLGSNGYLVILTTGNDYAINANSATLYDVTDGDLEGQTHSFLLVNTNGNGAPSSSDDIDGDDDGEIDAAYTAIWTFIDGIAFADDDGTLPHDEFAYADVIYAESAIVPTLKSPSTSTVISTSTQYDYAARIGNSTGSVVNNDASVEAVDWVGSDVPSSTSAPRLWLIGSSNSSVRAHPESWEGSELNHIGGPNPIMNTLGVESLTISDFQIFPNPANDVITVQSGNIKISEIQIHDILGKNVLSQSNFTNNRTNIDVSILKAGIYFVKITANDSSVTKKIIIQ